MAIAVDAILYQEKRGGVEKAIEGTVRGLLRRGLPWPADLFVSRSLFARLQGEPAARNMRILRVDYSSRPERILKEQVLALRRRATPVWHYLGYVIPPFPPKGKIVVSVYDVIALTHPHLCALLNRRYYGFALPRTLRRADRIVVPSRYVQDRILERYPGMASKIRVIPLPLPEAIASARGDTGAADDSLAKEPYLLLVGGLEPKKNVGFLLEAYARLPPDLRRRYELWVCGRRTRGAAARLGQMAERAGVGARVRFLGRVGDEHLPSLYKKARLLLFPSLEEGYGYPPLEAMALGTPAIVSDRGALPEVAGGAGAAVSPLNAEAFAAAMVRLLRDDSLYGEAREKGLAGVLRDTWDDYATELSEIYGELIA
jgi:alpha-1,3-rhamnosyl/mannosyltransferase